MALTAWNLAVVGAGPVGLALALLAARTLPQARISVFDARPLDRDVAADPRTLALALGSVQLLEQLGAWPEAASAPIQGVHVSQTPAVRRPLTRDSDKGEAQSTEPAVRLSAAEIGVPRLGAVLRYGALVDALQRAWLAAAAAQPERLYTRFGAPVAALKTLPDGVEVDAGIAERFDLAVVAEGGVFAEQSRKAIVADYGQTAWVGQVELAGGAPGMAFERFTRHGPVAVLPLPALAALAEAAAPGASAPARGGAHTAAAPPRPTRPAALVWCVRQADDPLRELDATQRQHVLASLLPPEAGRLVAVSPLKSFALGLNAERTLVQGRQVRIGNAAQTLHPVAGQGLNLGLRDAHALVQALRWREDLDAALAGVEWQRAPDRWTMIAATDFLARSFTWQFPGAAAARGLGLAALEALPPLKGLLARQMMFGWR
jgi:2-octaprenyl-6-methoxyphenol hydroxylase